MKKTLLFGALILGLLTPTWAFAGRLKVVGMSCKACEKQVTAAVCENSEIKPWFEVCLAKVTDAKNETGEIRYSLNKGVVLDDAKLKVIQKAVADTGRTIELPPIGKDPGGLL